MEKNQTDISLNQNNISLNQNNISPNQNEIINPLQCHQCQKVYTVNWYLQKHLKTCTGNTNSKYKCDYCDKIFQCNTSKYKHHKTCSRKHSVVQQQTIINNNYNNCTNIEKQVNNITIVLNSRDTDFDTTHIALDAFLKDIKRILNTQTESQERAIVLDYTKKLMENKSNHCIQKKDIKSNYSNVYIGNNQWEKQWDREVYPLLVNRISVNLSDMVYNYRDKIPKHWFDKMIGFFDYMSDKGYINTDDLEVQKEITKQFRTLIMDLKLIVHNITLDEYRHESSL